MNAAVDQIVWILTSYMVGAAVCTLLTGFLVKRFGRKRLMIFAMGTFMLRWPKKKLVTDVPLPAEA